MTIDQIKISLSLKEARYGTLGQLTDHLRLSMTLRLGERTKRVTVKKIRFMDEVGEHVSNALKTLVKGNKCARIGKAERDALQSASDRICDEIKRERNKAARRKSVTDRFDRTTNSVMRRRRISALRDALRPIARSGYGRKVSKRDLLDAWEEVQGEIAIRKVMES